MPAPLQRITYAMPRAAECFSRQELQMMTGQPPSQFGAVVLKELLDNAIDATEHAEAMATYAASGSTPLIQIGWAPDGDEQHVTLTVGDNGVGIPPATVTSVLDFATRTSDKAIYRSPTRGAQGNALKTVLGIPYALGIREPVVIEARGVRHSITVNVDPAGAVHVHPEVASVSHRPGTRVHVPLRHGEVDPLHWGRAFALFNPHVAVKICHSAHGELPCSLTESQCGDFYRATVAFPGGWRKYFPGDHTSAWWYTKQDLERLIFAKINASAQGQEPDLFLRDFVREFRGLTGTAKAKVVCAQVPGITRLSDFARHQAMVGVLYNVMRDTATWPSAEVLGTIGAAHFEHWFQQWYGVTRFWYDRKAVVSAQGIPCVIEVAVAETVEPGHLWTGVNFSPTFERPLANTYLECGKESNYGLISALYDLHVLPGDDECPPAAVALHIVSPVVEFVDRGKTRFDAPKWMAAPIGEALWKTARALYGEEEQRTKDAAKAQRRSEAREAREERARAAETPKEMTLKDAVFLVMQAAWEHATGQGAYRVSKRNLYYAVRDRIQEHTTRELEAGYFTHTLLPAYEREQAPLPGVYAESRGVLHEPHSDTQIILDDAVVASYIFPAWCYNKVLYVEKRTVWPVLESYRLAERHDMAILTGEGYATEAMHALFANASKNKQYQLFVLHNADPHGYNIARLLQEESLNMRGKGYAVEVFDLGLFIEDAVALGIRLEAFTRKSALPKELVLSEEARRIFEGEKQRGRNEWIGHRVELNALSAPQLVGYIERRLAACGARGKVIPSDAVLTTQLRGGCIQRIATAVQGEVERLLSLDAVTARVQRRFGHILPTAADRTMVEAALARDPARPWTAPLWIHTLDIVNPHYDAIMAAVREELLETIQHGALLGDEASAPADDDVDQADIDEDY